MLVGKGTKRFQSIVVIKCQTLEQQVWSRSTPTPRNRHKGYQTSRYFDFFLLQRDWEDYMLYVTTWTVRISFSLFIFRGSSITKYRQDFRPTLYNRQGTDPKFRTLIQRYREPRWKTRGRRQETQQVGKSTFHHVQTSTHQKSRTKNESS